MTQATDGSLWLGSSRGLYRFDGSIFAPIWLIPADQIGQRRILTLEALEDGSVWAGTNQGEAIRFDRKGTTWYVVEAGSSVLQLLHTADGVLWAAASNALYRFAGDHFGRIGANEGLPPGTFFLTNESNGALRATTLQGVSYLRDDHRDSFRRVPSSPRGFWQYVAARDGSLWRANWNGICQVESAGGAGRKVHRCFSHLQHSPIVPGLAIDSHGYLWIAESGFGVRRLKLPVNDQELANRSPPQEERLPDQSGSSPRSVLSIFVDREGSVWIATTRGLERFHYGFVRSLSLNIPGAAFGAVPGPMRDIYVATFTGGIWRVKPDASASRTHVPRNAMPIYQICSDGQGGLWVAAGELIGHLTEGNVWHSVRPPVASSDRSTALLTYADRRLWYSTSEGGLQTWDGRGWRRYPDQSTRRITTLMSGDADTLWIGYSDGSLAIESGGRWRSIETMQEGPHDAITALLPDGFRCWISSEEGLFYFDGMHIRKLKGDASQIGAASGLFRGRTGELYPLSERGLFAISSLELQKFERDDGYEVRALRYGSTEGIEGVGVVNYLRPSGWTDDNGTYVSTNLGVYVMDPRAGAQNQLAPPAEILGAEADDAPLSGRSLTVPPATHQLRIDYSAVHFGVEPLIFRYKLEGFDTSWQVVGSRRVAIYTNLSPGTYRFDVQSSLGGDHWTGHAKSATITVLPAWYQRKTFRAVAAIGILIGLWAFFQWRIRRAAHFAHILLRERLTERERLARDLHDTLLQGFQALLIRFSHVAAQLPSEAPASAQIEEALNLGDEVLSESRGHVLRLREEDSAAVAIDEELRTFGASLEGMYSVPFECTVEGRARSLRPGVAREILMIGREALLNAYRHGNATRVCLRIRYGRSFRLAVEDDGCGIAPEVLRTGSREEHWGLPGMRERAQTAGGHLAIRSAPGSTRVAVRISGSRAFENQFRTFWR